MIAWNLAMEEMTGISAQTMIGEGDFEYTLPFYGENKPLLTHLILIPEAEVESRYIHVQRQVATLVVDTFFPKRGKVGAIFLGQGKPVL